MRTCSKCYEEKDESEFYVANANRHRQKPGFGLRGDCKKCFKKHRALPSLEARKIHQQKKRLRLYNLSKEHYIKLKEKQNSKCAICLIEDVNSSLCIDHDHKTKKIRGLLCKHCNLGLGKFKDNRQFLLRAYLYLCGDMR